MTDFNNNNKFIPIPKLPETKTEYVLNEEQPRQQEQKSATEKIVDSVTNVPSVVKEAVVPAIHASDDKDKGKGSSSGRGSPKIVQKDTYAEAMRHASFEQEQARQQNLRDVGCELQ